MIPGIREADTEFIIRRLKTADETVNNLATKQNDDHLFFYSPANAVWSLYLFILFNSGATADLGVGISAPTGATTTWTTPGVMTTTPGAPLSAAAPGAVFAGTGADAITALSGLITMSTTEGLVRVTWAQDTADVSDTKVLKGSHLIATRVDEG